VEPPTFRTGVALVTVPVYVSDSAGRPVSGLGASDFEVQEDGKTVAVASVHEIDAGQLAVRGMAPQVAAAARRQFLLLFDLSFSSASGLVRARAAAIDFVRDELGPSDLAGVATTSVQNGVKLLVSFTSDRAELAKAIESLGLLHLDRGPDPLGLTYEFAQPGQDLASANPMEAMDSEDVRPRSRGLAELQEMIRQFLILYRQAEASSYAQRASGAMDGLRELAEALGAVQGRKQILFLSSGFSDRAVVGEQGTNQVVKDAKPSHGSIWESNRTASSAIGNTPPDGPDGRAFAGRIA
jgi:VWFA-related protein